MKNEYGTELDRNGYAPSILPCSPKACYLCGRSDQKLDRHEVFHGAYREKSKRYGLWVPLCHERCHLNGAHGDAGIDLTLKQCAEFAALNFYGWKKEKFIKIFGKNYL